MPRLEEESFPHLDLKAEDPLQEFIRAEASRGEPILPREIARLDGIQPLLHPVRPLRTLRGLLAILRNSVATAE